MENTFKFLFGFLVILFLPHFISGGQTNNLMNQTTVMTNGQRMTNLTWFTGSVYTVPLTDTDLPEVQALYTPQRFKELYEEDRETPLRRAEIIFFISLPAFLLWETLIFRTSFALTGGRYFNDEFTTREKQIHYLSSAGLAAGTALYDRIRIRKRTAGETVSLSMYRRTF